MKENFCDTDRSQSTRDDFLKKHKKTQSEGETHKSKSMLKRSFDIAFSILFFLIFAIPAIAISVLVHATSPGPILFWSQRVGQNNHLFWMPKFRTMTYTAPIIATNSLDNPEGYITNVGRVLRRFSLDEIPQLWCILKGDMSIVGPRPVLNDASEEGLLALRTQHGVTKLKPGLTGWAQINGRDFLNEIEKNSYDVYYLKNQSFLFDLKIVLITAVKVFFSHDIRH